MLIPPANVVSKAAADKYLLLCPNTDFANVKKHLSDPEIVDLQQLTGLASLTNHFTDPLGLEVEFPEEKI